MFCPDGNAADSITVLGQTGTGQWWTLPRWSTEQNVLSWPEVLGAPDDGKCPHRHEAIQDYFAESWWWTIPLEVVPRTQPEYGALIKRCSKAQGDFTTHRILSF